VGLRPSWRTYRTSFAITATWAVTVFCFNRVANTNYGYLNAKPDGPSTLDLLGGWPSYLLPEVAAVAASWAFITLPWVRDVHRVTRRPSRAVRMARAVSDPVAGHRTASLATLPRIGFSPGWDGRPSGQLAGTYRRMLSMTAEPS
jgi:hypothetical protein